MIDAINVFPGLRCGHWFVLAVNGRRAGCRCRCGVVREVAVSALESGASTSCGCAPPSADQIAEAREAKAEQERRQAMKNWRPGGRS
jgi:hypothetical protein